MCSPVIYAGRSAEKISGAKLPGEYKVLNEWEVLPADLAEALGYASTLMILDLFSFPYEMLSRRQWDIPLILVLPEGFDEAFLSTVFGEPLFRHVGFFDRVVTRNSALWEKLKESYLWVESQRMEPAHGSPDDVVAEILSRLEEEAAPEAPPSGEEVEPLRYWRERGEAFASLAPHRAVCSVHHGPDFNKAIHRTQAAVLEPQFAAARGGRTVDVPFDVVEVGSGVGRWALSFDSSTTRFNGVDVSEGMISAARANFPEARFDVLDDDLLLPHEDESLDMAFTATVMHHNPEPAKRTMISEMWRVLRTGGRLLFLEDFVFGEQPQASTVYPMSVLRFVALVLEETAGRVVLEHVESLRYPHDELTRGGVLAFSKIGAPQRW